MAEVGKTINEVDYKKLHLDNSFNPRLPVELIGKPEEEILKYMLQKGNVIELMASIGQNDFFAGEPLLVIPHKKKKDEYIVVEGNRRLSAVKLLNDPSLVSIKQKLIKQTIADANHLPKKIPIVVYNDRQDILNYLGYRHIVGIKAWDSLAKARYLKQLFDSSKEKNLNKKCLELARTIGSGTRTDYVKKLLSSYRVYEILKENDFYGIEDPDENIFFSFIPTAFSFNNILDFLKLDSLEDITLSKVDSERLRELTSWMFKLEDDDNTRLGESRNLKKLAKIVSNKDAVEALRTGKSLDAAFLLTEGAKETVVKAISESFNFIEIAFNHAKGQTLEPRTLSKLDEIAEFARAIKKLTSPND